MRVFCRAAPPQACAAMIFERTVITRWPGAIASFLMLRRAIFTLNKIPRPFGSLQLHHAGRITVIRYEPSERKQLPNTFGNWSILKPPHHNETEHRHYAPGLVHLLHSFAHVLPSLARVSPCLGKADRKDNRRRHCFVFKNKQNKTAL